ncbi:kinase-like domain-containing protein [Coniella lustricola]|uniref:Kinase-like domain-containing protein n=1 Tax=Coniella lustricola TaxID=2025994 RepID=A0A2T3A8A3_9PEZI|nr:kinase-like domain-containing protein [Coniella lustricola]
MVLNLVPQIRERYALNLILFVRRIKTKAFIMSNHPLPTFRLNIEDAQSSEDQDHDYSKRPSDGSSTNGSSSEPDEDDEQTLEDQLRHCSVLHANRRDRFWPPDVLKKLLTEKRVRDSLIKCGFPAAVAQKHAAKILGSEEESCILIFAILVLIDRLEMKDIDHILNCKMGLRDKHIPLVLRNVRGRQYLTHEGSQQRVCCSSKLGWKPATVESFDRSQRQIKIPTFRFKKNNKIEHQEFEDWRILPWCQEDNSPPVAAMSGGYGSVSRVRIHKDCHYFHEVLKSINVSEGFFAVKKLKNSHEKQYQGEVRALERFNGTVHEHLVTLLATFRQDGHYHMIFPWAHCDLDRYWEHENPNPNLEDVAFLRWLSKQCVGLMEAVSVIHNASHLMTEKRYGRHGDIKAENILWFRTGESRDKDRGIFVISDLGFTAINSPKSRSMQPNTGISTTPSYRPPECDIKDAVISRAFDIWSLGCLYLELLCWLLTGRKGKLAFDAERATPFIYGANVDIFFDIQRRDSHGSRESQFEFKVKDVVSKKMSELHANKNCTLWVHKLLDIVENEMLVVLAKNQQRSTSNVLLKKLQDLDSQCQLDENYCLRRVPDKTRLEQWRPPKGVVAPLNHASKAYIPERAHVET